MSHKKLFSIRLDRDVIDEIDQMSGTRTGNIQDLVLIGLQKSKKDNAINDKLNHIEKQNEELSQKIDDIIEKKEEGGEEGEESEEKKLLLKISKDLYGFFEHYNKINTDLNNNMELLNNTVKTVRAGVRKDLENVYSDIGKIKLAISACDKRINNIKDTLDGAKKIVLK